MKFRVLRHTACTKRSVSDMPRASRALINVSAHLHVHQAHSASGMPPSCCTPPWRKWQSSLRSFAGGLVSPIFAPPPNYFTTTN